ncbi:MAG: putative toxin-antitoxin system toxin component, PIN family [Bacteroidales bacterium]|nr:putative toxin-antitoxin system toxin component, PIN family [Bacteroidales bacterium]
MIYAVIDTNVFVSALWTKNDHAPTFLLLKALQEGRFTPLYNEQILAEYKEVLSRPKFSFQAEVIKSIVEYIRTYGILSERVQYLETMPDETDRVFYEVTLSHKEAYLVTGNQRHFPQAPIVVTPAQMLEILNEQA